MKKILIAAGLLLLMVTSAHAQTQVVESRITSFVAPIVEASAFGVKPIEVMVGGAAQNPVFTLPSVRNPSAIQFDISPDHEQVTGYEVDIYKSDHTSLQTINIGKPACTATCTVPLNVQPIAFGTGYYLRMRSVAGLAKSDEVISMNSFDRVPGGPSKIIAK